MVNPVLTTRLSFLKRLGDRSDKLSWDEFHRQYGKMLYRFARGCGSSHDEAEDIVQEVEMYLFKAMDRFKYDSEKGRFRSYLWAAVARAMGRRLKQQSRESKFRHNELPLLMKARTAREVWDGEWRLNCMFRAFSSLTREFHPVTIEAFRMHVLSHRSADETAHILGLSRDSVYQAKSRVLKRLKERIESIHTDEAV